MAAGRGNEVSTSRQASLHSYPGFTPFIAKISEPCGLEAYLRRRREIGTKAEGPRFGNKMASSEPVLRADCDSGVAVRNEGSKNTNTRVLWWSYGT